MQTKVRKLPYIYLHELNFTPGNIWAQISKEKYWRMSLGKGGTE